MGRTAEVFAVLDVHTVAHVRLAGIHPPRIYAEGIVVLLHLMPEQFARVRAVCVVERAEIAGAHPVADAVFHGLLVHPAVFVKFLIMFGRDIEFRPYGNHDTSVHGVDAVDHAFGIREAVAVELMAAP